jgi:hypothetical protein
LLPPWGEACRFLLFRDRLDSEAAAIHQKLKEGGVHMHGILGRSPMKAIEFRRIVMYIGEFHTFGHIVISYDMANDIKNIANFLTTYCHVFYP